MQESSDSASSWSLSALEEAASRVHLSSLDFGNSPRFIRGGSGAVSIGGGSGSSSRTRLQVTLTHESSMDQSSQLSQDSSNGSTSQPDEEDPSLSLEASDTSLQYSRTGLDSPTTASTPVGGANVLVTPSSSTGRGLGTSVIVSGRTEDSDVVADDEGSGSLQGASHSPGREEQNTEYTTSQGVASCIYNNAYTCMCWKAKERLGLDHNVPIG